MSNPESDLDGNGGLRATLKPLALRCGVCNEETLILPGCANETWLCGHCGAAIRQSEASGPRQKRPATPEASRRAIPLESLPDELARLTMEQGLRRTRGASRLPRLFEWSGSFSRIPGDPRVPKLVRLYGTAFTPLGMVAALHGVYALLTSETVHIVRLPGAHNPQALLLYAGLAVLLAIIGNGLRKGRRTAVYGAALACMGAIGCYAWLLPYPYISLAVGLFFAPLFLSAIRHWGRFR